MDICCVFSLIYILFMYYTVEGAQYDGALPQAGMYFPARKILISSKKDHVATNCV